MMDEMSVIDPVEFRELGYLQEVNRLFLHPLGLALEHHSGYSIADVCEIVRHADEHTNSESDMERFEEDVELVSTVFAILGLDQEHASRVWDWRRDAEGIMFGEWTHDAQEKADLVRLEANERKDARTAILGDMIQPVGFVPFDQGLMPDWERGMGEVLRRIADDQVEAMTNEQPADGAPEPDLVEKAEQQFSQEEGLRLVAEVQAILVEVGAALRIAGERLRSL